MGSGIILNDQTYELSDFSKKQGKILQKTF